MPVFFKPREIVVPGQLLARGNYKTGQYTYQVGNKIYSKIVGLAECKNNNIITVIPLNKPYIPKVGDYVIGKVVDVGLSAWLLDINAPYTASLPLSEVLAKADITKIDLSEYFEIGDYILCKIIAFDKTRDPLVTIKEKNCGKIRKGVVVEVSPAKIPRIIGKEGSMISMIKKELKVEIHVGQNGRIWIYSKENKSEVEEFAARIIKRIEREAHVSGLTDRIRKMIEEYKSCKRSRRKRRR